MSAAVVTRIYTRWKARRITWTVFMQNKTITFRLKKHLNRSKGCCCIFLLIPFPVSLTPRCSFYPGRLFLRTIYISLSVPLSAVYDYVCMYIIYAYTYITWLSTVTPFIQNTWAKRLLFFIILYAHIHLIIM